MNQDSPSKPQRLLAQKGEISAETGQPKLRGSKNEELKTSAGINKSRLQLKTTFKTLNLITSERGRICVEMSSLKDISPDEKRKKLMEAIGYLKKATESISFDYRSIFNLGVCYSCLAKSYLNPSTTEETRMGRSYFQKALKHFERALEIYPKSFDNKEIMDAKKEWKKK